VHSERLTSLARDAESLEHAGDVRAIQKRVARLSDSIDSGQAPATAAPYAPDSAAHEAALDPNPLFKVGAAAGGLALIAWKFKFILVFLATKAKLLLLGLSKTTTLFSMLLSLGLYWSLWGWRFALGLVLSIYVHEMGHVAALRHFGIPASAPMFLPGLGAMVRMKAYPQTVREDARVGLAGPIWGLGAAILSAGVYVATDLAIFAAIASVGAWINLFNLVPIWHLDGARGFRALSKAGRWAALAAIATCGLATQEGLFILIGLGALVPIFSREAPATSDRRSLLEYGLLLATLGALTRLPVPT
jgi:Zn-dependent protease